MHSVFKNFFAVGLYQGHGTPTDIVLHHSPNDLQAFYDDKQQHLGWKQFTAIWMIILATYHPQVNGTMYYAKSLTY